MTNLDELTEPTPEPEPENGRKSAVIQPPEGYIAVEAYIVYAHRDVIENPPSAMIGGRERSFEVPEYVAGLKQVADKAYSGAVVVSTTESLTRKKPREHIATVIWLDTPATAAARKAATKPKSGTLESKHVPKLMTELARFKLADDVIKEAQEREVKVAVVAREKLLAKHGITAEELQSLIDDFNNE